MGGGEDFKFHICFFIFVFCILFSHLSSLSLSSLSSHLLSSSQACHLQELTGYREDSHSGLIRYLLFSVETTTGKVQVTFVVNCCVQNQLRQEEAQAKIQSVLDYILSGKKRKKLLHSLWIHYHAARLLFVHLLSSYYIYYHSILYIVHIMVSDIHKH